jgi:hypothetical protein
MQDWIDRIALELEQPAMTADEQAQLLMLARKVAHATGERRLAPLAAFLVGAAVGKQPSRRREMIREALASIEALLPPGT